MMRWPALGVAVAVAVGALLFLQHEPDPDRTSGEAPRPAASSPIIAPHATPAASTGTEDRAVATTPEGSRPTAAELDEFAAQFAANPALIDLLEDANSPDPAVRAEAERALATLRLRQLDPAQPRP